MQLTAPSLAERYVPSGIILAAFCHIVSVLNRNINREQSTANSNQPGIMPPRRILAKPRPQLTLK